MNLIETKKNKGDKFDTVISACLLGIPCRYNKTGKINQKALQVFLKGKSFLICPEISAGLKTPRPACEIIGGDANDVLSGKAKIVDKNNKDYTGSFIKGAEIILEEIIRKHNIKNALLKSGSPSCGVKNIFSGNFDGEKIKGCGVFTALLKAKGVKNIREL